MKRLKIVKFNKSMYIDDMKCVIPSSNLHYLNYLFMRVYRIGGGGHENTSPLFDIYFEYFGKIYENIW